MLAHAKAFRAYNGTKPMGFAANADWYEPLTLCEADQQAAVNAMVWEIGLFWDLLTTGAWAPEIAAVVHHPRLPVLSVEDVELLRGAHGSVYYQNMYTGAYAWATGANAASDCQSHRASWRSPSEEPADFTTDSAAGKGAINPITNETIGALAPGSSWLHFTPTGLPKLQRWIAARYLQHIPDLKLVVTENGWGGAYPTKEQAVDDLQRCEYYRQYIGNMSKFTPDGKYGKGPLMLSEQAPTILGYFAWSLMDNFEWNDGYSQRFGITYVDYCGPHNNFTCKQTRTPKLTASWFTELLKDRSFRDQPHLWESLPECKWYSGANGTEPASSSLRNWEVVGAVGLVVAAVCVGVAVVRRHKRQEAHESNEPLAQVTAW